MRDRVSYFKIERKYTDYISRMDKNTISLGKVIADASKIIDIAHKEDVKTPKEFAKVFEKNPPSTLTSNEVKTQVKGLQDFESGKISYSQMRSMCG